MRSFSGALSETLSTQQAVPLSGCGDTELQAILVRQTLTPATHARVIKLKALVKVLINRDELMASELASAIGCSFSAIKRYIRELHDINVIEIAGYLPQKGFPYDRPLYRLGANQERALAILSWSTTEPSKKFCKSRSSKLIETCSGTVHILEDDVPYDYEPSTRKHSRDPLVAALFGNA